MHLTDLHIQPGEFFQFGESYFLATQTINPETFLTAFSKITPITGNFTGNVVHTKSILALLSYEYENLTLRPDAKFKKIDLPETYRLTLDFKNLKIILEER